MTLKLTDETLADQDFDDVCVSNPEAPRERFASLGIIYVQGREKGREDGDHRIIKEWL